MIEAATKRGYKVVPVIFCKKIVRRIFYRVLQYILTNTDYNFVIHVHDKYSNMFA